MIQAEVTFGGCDGGCGVGKDTCIVRKLPRIVLWEIPADMRKTLVGLHKFGQEGNLKENLTISSALGLGENIIEETVELYGGKINDIFITIGGTPVSESANFYNEKLPRLGTKIDENGRIFIGFDHIEEETRESIFTHFDTALSTLLKNWRLMPEGKSLGIGLGKNNSKDFVLWLECYEDLRLAIEFGIATGHENLDKTIDTIRKIGNFQQDREIIFSDIREGRTGFSHFFILEISGQKLPILIQVLPAVEQSDKIESTPGGDIVPLIAPKFVAPFHNIYAMNARKNRISHELYQRTLAEITGTGDAVETYNHRFLEVLHQNS